MFLSRYIKAHHISRAALIAGGIAAAIVFFIVGAIIRLLIGPISLGPLGNMLPNALAEALPGVTVHYDEAAIEWSWEQSRIELVILGAKVYDSEGRIIAQAPQADIDLAAGPLIFHGKAVVQRITLEGVQLTLVRTLTGGLRLGVEKDKNQKDFLSRIADQLSLNNDKASSLQEFAVRNARIAFYDEPTKLFLVAPDANFRVATAGTDLKATLEADVEVSGHPAHVTGEFTLPPQHGPVKGAVSVTGLDLRALSADGKTFAGMKQLGLSIDMSASFTMQGARLLDAEFGIGAKGALDLGLSRGPLKIRTAQIDGRYDSVSRRILIEDGNLDADGASAHMLGQADFVYDPDGTLSRIAFESHLDKVALTMPGVFAAPVALRDVSARGSYLLGTRDIVLDRAVIAGGSLSVQASGKVTLVPGKTPAIELKGQIAPMGVRDVLRYWPRGVAAGGRDWIDRNAFAGTLGPIAFETHFPAGILDEPLLPEGALKVTIPIANGEANYIQGLTHVTQLRGVATLTGDTLVGEVQSGRVGPLVLSDGHATITNLHIPGPPGDFKAHVAGSLQDVLTLVDKKPLNYPTRFGIDIAQTKGTAALDLDFHLPLRKELHVDDVNIAIKAAIGGFAMAMNDRTKLSDGQITVAIDNTKLHAAGTALLADSKLNLDWTEDFRTTDPVTTRVAIKGVLDNGGREALNFPSSSVLKGPANITATLTGHRGALASADMTLDLTPATLSLDLIGLNKPSGFQTTAHIGVSFGPASSIRAATLKLSGPGVTASGSASFDKDGHLIQLAFPQVHFGAIDDFSFTMTHGAAGSTDIAVRGRSLDGTRLAGRGSGSSGTGSDTTLDGPFHVDARLDRLMLRNGVAIAPFAVDVSGVGDRPSAMKISGSLGKSTIAGELVPTDAGRKLTFSATDLSQLSKGLFGFNSLRGGRIDLAATLPGKAGDSAANTGPDYQGKLTFSDFKIVNQPFLTRLFSAGSLDGLVSLMQDQGIAIDKLEVPFSSKNGVIDVKGARASGPAIGFSADGYIDRPKNAIAIKGTLAPLFGLNSVLGKIPLIGPVIVGKPGEGIFGVSYSVHGNADQPDVDVNPLSVLTPGILRRIFEGKIPTAAQAPSNNQPAPAPAPATPAPPVVPPTTSPATPKPE